MLMMQLQHTVLLRWPHAVLLHHSNESHSVGPKIWNMPKIMDLLLLNTVSLSRIHVVENAALTSSTAHLAHLAGFSLRIARSLWTISLGVIASLRVKGVAYYATLPLVGLIGAVAGAGRATLGFVGP